MKKVLCISTSMRQGSRSREVLKAFKKTYADKSMSYIDLSDPVYKDMACIGCDLCQSSCCHVDSNRRLTLSLTQAEVILLGMPIYFGSMSAKAKSLLEITYALKSHELKGKSVIVVFSADQKQQEGIAVLDLLPWLYKNQCQLVHVECINKETSDLDMLIKRLYHQAYEVGHDQKTFEIDFTDLDYLNVKAGIPISYKEGSDLDKKMKG